LGYSLRMKLSAYAKQVGVTYSTAHTWWKAGQLDAYHLPSGAIMVRETMPRATGVALSARVSSAVQQDDLMRQLQRLSDNAAARGSQVVAEVRSPRASTRSGPSSRSCSPMRREAFSSWSSGYRLTRLGYGSIWALLEHAGRHVEVLSPSDTGNDLVDDFVAVITSLAARLYGRRHAKRRAAQMQACVKQCIEQGTEQAEQV
jgi:putative resolvase